MKVKDLPPQTSLEQTKVRIPEEYRHEVESTGLDTMDVYLRSQWFAGIWVRKSPDAERVFPLQIAPSQVLEWEVFE